MEHASQQERSHVIVVVSATEDDDLRDELEQHLNTLVRKKTITLWDSRDIPVGTRWQEAYQTALEKASAVLFLLSAKFFATDQCD